MAPIRSWVLGKGNDTTPGDMKIADDFPASAGPSAHVTLTPSSSATDAGCGRIPCIGFAACRADLSNFVFRPHG